MKRFLAVLSLMLGSVFSSQLSAATFDLGAVYDFTSFSGTFRGKGPFEDTYIFTAPDNTGINVSLTNTFIAGFNSVIGKISDFSAKLDGVDLTLSSGAIFQLLSGGIGESPLGFHALVISGASAGSYGVSIAVATPVPAALWLFGSAAIGLAGIVRRRRV